MEKQKVFCMKCKKDLSDIEALEKCECGSRDFVYGKTVAIVEDKVRCGCGSESFEMVAHINMNPKYIATYKCTECGESVSTEVYYESPYY